MVSEMFYRSRSASAVVAAGFAIALSPQSVRAANYTIDNNVAQTLADLPASPITGFLTVGDANPNQALTIGSPGYSAGVLQLGNQASSTGNTVVITGTGANYSSNGHVPGPALVVGSASSGNQLTISSGATVTITQIGGSGGDAIVGYTNTANQNTLTVTGPGSTLAVNVSTLYVGFSASNNTLLVTNGGTVTATQMRVGGGSGSFGGSANNNLVRISGVGSSLTTSGSFNLGATGNSLGSGNLLEVLDGAHVSIGIASNKTLTAGQADNANNNGVSVQGTGALLTANNLVIGSASVTGNSGNYLSVGNGGQVVSLSGITFNKNSLYIYGLGGNTAALASASGTVTIGSNTTFRPLLAGGQAVSAHTMVLTGGSVGGTFTTLDKSFLPGSFASSVRYTPTAVWLDLTANLGSGAALNQNQSNVANALNGFFNGGGALPPGFLAVFGLGAGALPGALTQLSGEIATAPQQTTFNAMNQFMGVMTDPFIDGRGNPVSGGGAPNAYANEQAMAYAAKRNPNDALAAIYTKAPVAEAFAQRWSVWAAGYGGSQTTSGNAVVGSNDTRSSIYGTAVGADYRLSPNTLAGFALAGGGTNFSVANNLGSGRSDLFQAGAFVRHNVGAAYLSGALAYGWQDVTTNRTLTIAGVDQLRAQFNANAWSGRVEGGYRFVSQGFGWTPYAAGQFTTFELPTYAERAIVGANTFALAFNGRSVTDTRSELGLRTDRSFAAADGIFTLRGRLAWAHDYNPDRAVGATFQTLPGASFVVNGARQASDSALVTASAEKKWLNGWSAAATFEGEFSNVTTSYAGKGVVRYAW